MHGNCQIVTAQCSTIRFIKAAVVLMKTSSNRQYIKQVDLGNGIARQTQTEIVQNYGPCIVLFAELRDVSLHGRK